jgi:hypothetical protein
MTSPNHEAFLLPSSSHPFADNRCGWARTDTATPEEALDDAYARVRRAIELDLLDTRARSRASTHAPWRR